MARQIIDLRRQGPTNLQQTSQAIAGIMQTLGRVEQTRRERQQLDRITRAIASGASTIEAINAVATQPAGISKGLPGILQKIGGAVQPSPGRIPQGIQQSLLQRILAPEKLLSREERREKAIFGTRPRPGDEPILTRPERREKELFGTRPRPKTEKPKKRKGFSLNELKTLEDAIPDLLDRVEGQVEKTAIAGLNRRKQSDLAAAYKRAALEAGYETWTIDKQKQFDLKWDRLAKAQFKPRKAVSKETKEQINVGWNQNSPEVRQVRKELREGIAEIPDADAQVQPAPHVKLEPFWKDLSDEEKAEITQRLNEDPKNIDSILRILESG